MGQRIDFLILNLFLIEIYFCCFIEQSTPFTIKLTHRYAQESPFYISNLSDREIVERLNFQTKTRKQRVSLANSIVNDNNTLLDLQSLRPSLDFEAPFSNYLVKVSLGRISKIMGSSHKSYYLVLDTGSSITWLQCEDCKKSPNHCYRQTKPPFPNSKSRSYQPLPCGMHPLCFADQCIGDSCSYYAEYADNSYSTGILAHEKFVFPSSTRNKETVPIVFGCGIDNRITHGEDDHIMAGIFGIGWGPHSFVNQINSFSQGRFSYCLPPKIEAARGSPAFLRFGYDIPSYSTLPNTRLTQYPGDDAYYVKLLDVAINGVRLNIPSGHFKKRGRYGGCIFDTGYALTRVSAHAYQLIKHAVERHIATYDRSLQVGGNMFGYDLCYMTHKPFRGHGNLPFISFHFEGNAQFVIKPEVSFYIDTDYAHYDYICLSIVSSDDPKTVIGSDLQANHLIVYDVSGQRMYFGPRDCAL